MSSPQPHKFLDALRAATKDQHARLEEVIGLEAITESEPNYYRLLQRFHGIWEPLEDLLAKSPLMSEEALNLTSRFRANRIPEDLDNLCNGEEPSSAREMAELPWTSVTRGEAAGIAYVLEGSTLGGQIIGKRLREKLGITPEKGASFFAGHGDDNPRMWKRFTGWAESSLDQPEIIEAAAAGKETFQCLVEWFENPDKRVD